MSWGPGPDLTWTGATCGAPEWTRKGSLCQVPAWPQPERGRAKQKRKELEPVNSATREGGILTLPLKIKTGRKGRMLF